MLLRLDDPASSLRPSSVTMLSNAAQLDAQTASKTVPSKRKNIKYTCPVCAFETST